MRVLTAVGICNEVGPSKYSPNDVTQEFTEQGLGNGVNHLSVSSHIIISLEYITDAVN